jgi:hypothetical protein
MYGLEQIGAEINAAQIERLHHAAAHRGFAPRLLRRRNFCGRADGRFLSEEIRL